ncbi:MAG: CPBP family glutamic-type intramembrane protease [Spirochaetia bacterium]|jgi:membrane protease YdiL (CAAX protease family)|nr:CPBP family glutamic-type intramembrane protease [Spirochaetia bacterium]
MNLNLNVQQLTILIILGVLGSIAVIPYSLGMQSTISFSLKLLILSVIQSIILIGIITTAGMWTSGKLGLSITSSWNTLYIPVLLGLLGGSLIVAMDYFMFLPQLPAALTEAGNANLPFWKRFLASFYGGITEEILLRLFLLSGLLWLLTKLWHGPEGNPLTIVFWIVNIITAILFGLGHLPATKMLTELTPLIITRGLLLNGIGGLLFGWIFWKFGLAAAMVSHFSADIVLHVIVPFVKNLF